MDNLAGMAGWRVTAHGERLMLAPLLRSVLCTCDAPLQRISEVRDEAMR